MKKSFNLLVPGIDLSISNLIFVASIADQPSGNMKKVFEDYAAYHLWANQRLVDFIVVLPEEQQQRELPSSFPSLFKTLVHMFNVDTVWWQRTTKQEFIMPPGAGFNGTITELTTALIKQDKVWESFVNYTDSAAFENVITYHNSRGERFEQPLYQLLTQLFNHGTYHRGQLVTMFHQLGVTKIPPTDFIVWGRREV